MLEVVDSLEPVLSLALVVLADVLGLVVVDVLAEDSVVLVGELVVWLVGGLTVELPRGANELLAIPSSEPEVGLAGS